MVRGPSGGESLASSACRFLLAFWGGFFGGEGWGRRGGSAAFGSSGSGRVGQGSMQQRLFQGWRDVAMVGGIFAALVAVFGGATLSFGGWVRVARVGGEGGGFFFLQRFDFLFWLTLVCFH